MVEPLTKDEAIQVIRAGFARALLDVTFQCTAPIYWFTVAGGRREPILNNGTIFFVDAGEGPFGITARHVISGYRSAAAQMPGTACEIGGVQFDPLKSLIAEDTRTDIATLTLRSEQLKKIGKVPHLNPRGWPPKPPEIGKGIFFGGYPGKHKLERPGVIQWGFVGGLDIAANVHEDHISVQFNREDWVSQEGMQGPEFGEPWGGVSGSPVFAVVQNTVVSWRLVGVAIEFGSTFEILHASSLSRVCPDGSILS